MPTYHFYLKIQTMFVTQKTYHDVLALECLDNADALKHKATLEAVGEAILAIYPAATDLLAENISREDIHVGSSTELEEKGITYDEQSQTYFFERGVWTAEEILRELEEHSLLFRYRLDEEYESYRVPQSFRPVGNTVQATTDGEHLIRRLFADHWSVFDGLVIPISSTESYRLERIYKNTARPHAILHRFDPSLDLNDATAVEVSGMKAAEEAIRILKDRLKEAEALLRDVERFQACIEFMLATEYSDFGDEVLEVLTKGKPIEDT